MSAAAGLSKTCAEPMNCAPASSEDDEYEEKIMIMELHGVLDGESVRQAASTGQLIVRQTDTDNPIVQIGSSVYCGKWTQPLGTDLIFRSSGQIVHNPPANEFETNNMFPPSGASDAQLELIGVSSTRLVGRKALISSHPDASSDGPSSDEMVSTPEDKHGSTKAASPSPSKKSIPKNKLKPPAKTLNK